MSLLPNYDSPNALKIYLDEHGMGMQKKFGQNFLINAHARKKLLDALEIDANSHVWEIGAGLGAMTCDILKTGCQLTAFEIDRGFIIALKDFFSDCSDTFTLVEGDVLKTWKAHALQAKENKTTPNRLFGNLPYNIAATIIGDFISENFRFDIAVLTVQKEVALRMAAKQGTENYSSFSVLCQWAYDVQTVADLSAGSFWPPPHVDSRAVKLIRKADFPRCKNPALFMTMQRALFSSRRKTIKNNLNAFAPLYADEALHKAGIDPQIRAECLGIDILLFLSDILFTLMEESTHD